MTVELKLPFSGKWFVLQGGDTVNVNHHMKLRSQWYGIDMMRVDGASGRSLHKETGSKSKKEDFYSWNESIISPATGEVIQVVDRFMDNELGTYDIKNPAGNYVAIKIKEEAYIFLGHLKKDSISVSIGDFVKAGDLIGKCGNSGNSDYPHIHMHMQDMASFNQGTGLNMTFTGIDIILSGKLFQNISSWPLIKGLFVSNSKESLDNSSNLVR
jgi:murein DD-endopeptidase MepM/ murein hydrolase activator NlpD